MLKKLIAVLVILTLVLSLAACGKKNGGSPADNSKQTTKQADNKPDDDDNDGNDDDDKPSPGSSKGGIYDKPGEELVSFFDAYDEAIDPFEKPMNEFETDDFSLFDVSMDYLTPQAYMSTIGMYDLLEVFGTDEGEYRKESGGVITFGEEFIRDKNGFSPNDLEGDKVVEKGSLDTKSNTLKLEQYVERDGELMRRMVLETVLLSNGTWVSQVFHVNFSMADRGIEDAGKAYFMAFDKDTLEMLTAKFDYDFEFTYTSIEGKSNVDVEDMAKGYELLRGLTIKNGKAEAKKY